MHDRSRLISNATDLVSTSAATQAIRSVSLIGMIRNLRRQSLRGLLRFGSEPDMIDFMWIDCLVNGRAKAGERASLGLVRRSIRPPSPRWDGGNLSLHQQSSRFLARERHGTRDG